MYRNIALLCVFALLCACGPLPVRNESGLFGKYPENFVDSDGFTLWMPKNMTAMPGMYPFVVQRYMNYCKNGNYIGVEYEATKHVHKEMPDGTKIYAYYYYDEDVDVGVDAPAFNLTPTQIKVGYNVIFNIYVDKENKVTRCKYAKFQWGITS